jgi:hypothetical protein
LVWAWLPRYDPFGNVASYAFNGIANSAYDTAAPEGHPFILYEGATLVGVSGPPHVRVPSGTSFCFDENGNFTYRPTSGQNLSWDHAGALWARLYQVSNAFLSEFYFYDTSGQRIRKSSNGTNTYYPNRFYEQTAPNGHPIITNYYYFNGKPTALRRNGVLTYLHAAPGGHPLSSTVLETNAAGNVTAHQTYYAYGRQRDSGAAQPDQCDALHGHHAARRHGLAGL